jgi:hypothetical protein
MPPQPSPFDTCPGGSSAAVTIEGGSRWGQTFAANLRYPGCPDSDRMLSWKALARRGTLVHRASRTKAHSHPGRYSRLTGLDEEGTHAQLTGHLRSLVDPKISEHRGRIVKNTGMGCWLS